MYELDAVCKLAQSYYTSKTLFPAVQLMIFAEAVRNVV